MLPLFGSRVTDFIHEKLDHMTCALIRFELIDAIQRWEPRIILDREGTSVTAYPAEFFVAANLRYYLRPRSEAYNFAIKISRTGGVSQWLD